jgi:outer membrane immunogenic protein
VVVEQTWTGWWVGANVGGAWSTADSNVVGTDTFSAAFLSFAAANGVPLGASLGKGGFAGGVEAGYDYQINSVVLGVIGRFDWLDTSDTQNTLIALNRGRNNLTVSYNGQVEDLGVLLAKIGFAVPNTGFQVYADAGGAIGNVKSGASVATNGFNWAMSDESTRVGWSVGGGIAYLITPHWSVNFDYQYADLGHSKTTGSILGLIGVEQDIAWKVQTATVGAHYRF